MQDRKVYDGAYRLAHREKICATAKTRYIKNQEKNRAYQVAYYAAHPERRRVAIRAWELKNPEKRRAYDAAYQVAHPEVGVLRAEARRARIVEAPGAGVSRADWAAILRDANGICQYCGAQRPLTQDHIVSLDKGGAHSPANIAAVCGSCNSSKGTKDLKTWKYRV